MMKKKVISIITIAALCVSILGGCGNNQSDYDEEIELVTPVGVTENYAKAEYRDLVSYKVYSGKVVPKVTEYGFSSDQNFNEYGVLPGSEIKRSEAIAYATTESIDNLIEQKEEQISNRKENYYEKLTELTDNYTELKYSMIHWENLYNSDPENETYEYYYRLEKSKYEIAEEELKEATETFELDNGYDEKKLKRLKQQLNGVMVTSDMDGVVVAINQYDWNAYIEKNTSVGAVGDLSQLEVKCDDIYENDIKKAADVYAMVNGKRYETFLKGSDSDTDEAEKTTSTVSYSTFILEDPNGEVKAGDYVVIVLVSAIKKDALCVPSEAIGTDADGAFVYVRDGESTVYTSIKTGMKSGFYTEVTSGLEEGTKIISEFKIPELKKTEKLTKGSVGATFNEDGYIFYSKVEMVKNPIEYGTTYIYSLLVKQYERVEKGQPIAEISVTEDSISIKRRERQLLRMNETLNELIKDGEEKNQKSIKAQRESIAELTKTINEMKSDAATTTILAPYDGIITRISYFEEGDILQRNANVVQIAEESNCFVVVEDASGQLTCGNTVSIDYRDSQDNRCNAQGEVVTVAACALSEELNTGFSLIRVSPEDLTKMCSSNFTPDGWWRRSNFDVTAAVRTVDNVVLVPKKAVTTENGVTYVTVIDENGKPQYKSFIAGGSDNTYYWVAEGLSEGQEICLE